ncbi:MAG TPA: ribulose-phosphate 3-epimerase, partial [Coriobacteriia bacterium]|nr:ribulose-phosphate 3-epimerase [Coriobacteriia bacterium]
MSELRLAPSMMCVDVTDTRDVLDVFNAQGVELLHVDVMDGSFVPNIMLGTNYVRDLRAITQIPLDLHLMVDDPLGKLDWFEVVPGEWVSVHAEATAHLQRTIDRIRAAGARPRVALNPATPLSVLDWVFDDIDGVLLMTVNPGFAGQALALQTLRKIAALRTLVEERGHPGMDIEVDGNVSVPNAQRMAQAGATTFVLGTSALFGPGSDIAHDLRLIRRAIATAQAGEPV